MLRRALDLGHGDGAVLLARVSLMLTALAFGGFGVLFLAWPETISVIGIELTTGAARAEVRTFYGGLELGFALFFAIAAARRSWFVPALIAQVAALGGAAAGRVIGLLIDGTELPLLYLLLAMESAGALVGALALLKLRRAG